MGSTDPVISEKLKVKSGMAYTIVAANLVENLELAVVGDSMKAMDGKTKVRVGHLLPDAPTVDVGLVDGESLLCGASFEAIIDCMEFNPGT
ncbi:DUF4397 domain-containing protein [Bacillus sp. 2205SS5-2]|uniref:DUF4397 domain-containing protein n=1 Tax=Bacillus sp. 2205SS5-2 TaxID=3109031 RepID=UPI0030044D57